MVDFLMVSKIAQILVAIFERLINEPAGLIFLLTFGTYLISYSAYSGYLAWFAGGYGAFPFSPVGWTVIDILTLVPTALLTFLYIISQILHKYLLPRIFLLGLATGLGLGSAFGIDYVLELVGFEVPSKLALTFVFIGLIIWFSSILPLLMNETKDKGRSFVFSVFFIGAFLFMLGTLNVTSAEISNTMQQSQVTDYLHSPIGRLSSEITVIIILVIALVSPSIFGLVMAERAVRDGFLSKINYLSLSQPIQVDSWLFQEEKILDDSKRGCSWWFIKPSTPNPSPDIYTYKPKNELYLIASFKQNALFFTPPVDVNKRGKLLMLSNDIIKSIEMNSNKLKLSE